MGDGIRRVPRPVFTNESVKHRIRRLASPHIRSYRAQRWPDPRNETGGSAYDGASDSAGLPRFITSEGLTKLIANGRTAEGTAERRQRRAQGRAQRGRRCASGEASRALYGAIGDSSGVVRTTDFAPAKVRVIIKPDSRSAQSNRQRTIFSCIYYIRARRSECLFICISDLL